MKVPVALTINGSTYEIDVEPRRTLADAIREDCGLTGTHLGCEHGVCGACTILLDDEPVRSCLVFAVQVEDADIRTVEGLSTDGEALSPLQQAFMDHHGLQCGFCTPGYLMLITWSLERDRRMSDDEIKTLVSSNLCRCTGYQNIVASVKAAAQKLQDQDA
jgi:aerobic carbon-monoxide dehydrogenase small subunit